LVVPSCLVHLFQNFCFVETLRKFVEVAEKFGTVTPRGLNGRYRRGVVEKYAHCVRKRGFTCTGYTLQNHKTRRRHTCDKQPYDTRIVIQSHTRTSEVTEAVAKFGQSDFVVIDGRNVIFVNFVDFGEFVEARLTRGGLLLFLLAVLAFLFAFVSAYIAHAHTENTVFFSRHFDDLLFEIRTFFNEILRQNFGFLKPCEFAYAERRQNDYGNDSRNDQKNKYDCDSPLARAEIFGVILESVRISFVVENVQNTPKDTADTFVVKRAEKGFQKLEVLQRERSVQLAQSRFSAYV